MLEQLVRRSLQKSPEARFQSAREMVTALEAVAAEPATTARASGGTTPRLALFVGAFQVVAAAAYFLLR